MKVGLLGAFVLISITVLSCASPSSTEIGCDDFQQQQHVQRNVTVSSGEEITVSLCSNPSTGFQWVEEAQINDAGIIEQTGYSFIAPGEKNGQPPAPGSAGTSVWTFRALKAGNATIEMEYSRPWEGGEKRQWTCELSVTVK